MNLVAIAIDDEPLALTTIQNHASRIPFLELRATFTDALKVLPWLQTNQVDLMFLDVEMPDVTGIQFLNMLKNVPAMPMVIFTTGYGKYAQDGFDMDAIDFLRKPFPLDRFAKACNKALEQKILRLNSINNRNIFPLQTEPAFVFLKTGGFEEERIMLDDILYIEATGDHYPDIVLKTGKRSPRQSMTALQQILPGHQFVRIHRSYIIALDKVDKIGRYELTIAGKQIPFGATYESAVASIRERYTQY